MCNKQSLIFNWLSHFILVMSFLSADKLAKADSPWLWFDGQDIDYWNDGTAVSGTQPTRGGLIDPEAASIRDLDRLPFDWRRYEDVSSIAFWDDGGDYVPPRPLRILAASPTRENTERVIRWQRKKLEATTILTRLLTTVGSKAGDDPNFTSATKSSVKDTNKRATKPKFVYIYRSDCPHCQRMHPVIEDLAAQGMTVITFQLDHGARPPLHSNSFPYDARAKRNFPIDVTPTLFVKMGDKIQKWEGYMSKDDLNARMSTTFG